MPEPSSGSSPQNRGRPIRWFESLPPGRSGVPQDRGIPLRRWEIVAPPVLGGPRHFQGRAAIAAPIRNLLTAIPDLGLEVRGFGETEDGGMLEWRHFGTHTGAWNRWSPQGEPVEFSGVSVYRIAGDEIADECIYFDPDLLVREWAVPLGALASVGIGTLRAGRAIRRRRRSGG